MDGDGNYSFCTHLCEVRMISPVEHGDWWICLFLLFFAFIGDLIGLLLWWNSVMLFCLPVEECREVCFVFGSGISIKGETSTSRQTEAQRVERGAARKYRKHKKTLLVKGKIHQNLRSLRLYFSTHSQVRRFDRGLWLRKERQSRDIMPRKEWFTLFSLAWVKCFRGEWWFHGSIREQLFEGFEGLAPTLWKETPPTGWCIDAGKFCFVTH